MPDIKTQNVGSRRSNEKEITTVKKTNTLIAAAAAVVLLPGLLAACSGAPSSNSTDTASGTKQSGAAVASCMRDKGYDMPDPSSGGQMKLTMPDGVDAEQWGADFEKCAGTAGAGAVQAASPMDDPAQSKQVAKCIRDKGISDYPDDQEGQLDYKPSDAEAMRAAESECVKDVFGKDTGSGTGITK